MNSELARFFTEIVPVLRGETSAATLTATLGATPLAASRVAFYRTLMKRNVARILCDLFPATHAYARLTQPGCWPAWVSDYDRRHPPAGYDPNAFGTAFPSFLAETLTREPDVTPALVELADYEWLRFSLGSSLDQPERESQIAVRHYDHDVPHLRSEVLQSRAVAAVTRRPVAVIVFGDPALERARTIYATMAMLAALARRGGAAVDFARLGVSLGQVDDAEQHLRELGLADQPRSTSDCSRPCVRR